jgi:hypothetical protein
MRIREAASHAYYDLVARPRLTATAAAILLSGGLVAGFFVGEQQEKDAGTAKGTVECTSGAPVEGVWVDAANGKQSGWAHWQTLGKVSVAAFDRALPDGGDYAVHVGCGGTPGDWLSSSVSQYVSSEAGSVEFVCQDVADSKLGICSNS